MLSREFQSTITQQNTRNRQKVFSSKPGSNQKVGFRRGLSCSDDLNESSEACSVNQPAVKRHMFPCCDSGTKGDGWNEI